MYNPKFIFKEFMKEELDKVPKSRIFLFSEDRTLQGIEEWIKTLSGKFTYQWNGLPHTIQLKFKKPFVVIKDPIKRTYQIWTENRGGVIK